MNTIEIQEQIKNLKSADLAALKAGTKSNFLTAFVRETLIAKAYEMDSEMKKEASVNLNMIIASYIAPSIALMTKDGAYPKVLNKAVMTYKDGDIKFTYTVNAKGLTPDYIEKLNEKLKIKITV